MSPMQLHLHGIDHVVLMVHDLAAAAQDWRRLGFTVSPRGTHSAHIGTANHTLMLEDDYIELLGVLEPTELNAPGRAFLTRRGDGLERVAFATRDARAGAAELRRRGLDAIGPIEFARPVSLEDGRQVDAAFSVFHWPFELRPSDVRLFACEHRTREAVWLPGLRRHPNGARRLLQVELLSPEPLAAAQRMAAVAGLEAHGEDAARGWIDPGGRGVRLNFQTRADFASAHGLDPSTLPIEGAVGLALGVDDIAAVRAHLAGLALPGVGEQPVIVPPPIASGVCIRFETLESHNNPHRDDR